MIVLACAELQRSYVAAAYTKNFLIPIFVRISLTTEVPGTSRSSQYKEQLVWGTLHVANHVPSR